MILRNILILAIYPFIAYPLKKAPYIQYDNSDTCGLFRQIFFQGKDKVVLPTLRLPIRMVI